MDCKPKPIPTDKAPATKARPYSKLPPCELESKESLEQLRVLYNGEKIYTEEACESSGIGIDTEDDLEKARQFIQNINWIGFDNKYKNLIGEMKWQKLAQDIS